MTLEHAANEALVIGKGFEAHAWCDALEGYHVTLTRGTRLSHFSMNREQAVAVRDALAAILKEEPA